MRSGSAVVTRGRTARPAPALPALLRERPGLLAVPALALLLWLVYGSGYVDYDALYALVWGQILAGGQLPVDLTALHSPTSHPLDTLLAVVVSPLSRAAALDVFQAVSVLSFAGLGWAACRLGERLFAPATGVVLAVILLTRPVLVHQALTANVDVPFLALVLAAAAMEAQRPRRGWPVLATLAVAGLLRPEAWLLALAYVVWLWPAATPGQRVRALAIALVAPVVWLLFDLWLAGDALHSLHGTSNAATRIGRPQGFGTRIFGARGLEEAEEAHECASCQGRVCGHARLLEGCGAEKSASGVRGQCGTRRISFALRRRGRRRSARDGAHEWGQGGAFRQLG